MGYVKTNYFKDDAPLADIIEFGRFAAGMLSLAYFNGYTSPNLSVEQIDDEYLVSGSN